MKTHWIGGTLALAVMCLGSGVSAMAAGDLGPLPVEVWNQAYQETYAGLASRFATPLL